MHTAPSRFQLENQQVFLTSIDLLPSSAFQFELIMSETQPIVAPQAPFSPLIKSTSLMSGINDTPVSSELKSMVAAPAPPAPAQGSKHLTTVLAAVTTAFAITTICLSIAIASDTGKTMVPAPGSSDGTKSYDVKVIEFPTTSPPPGENICKDAKKKAPLPEIDCIIQDINGEDIVNDGFALGTAEQSGRNVTKGHQGGLEVTTVPITGSYRA